MCTDKVILLVDDDPDYRLQQETRLRAAGYEVMACESRSEAEELVNHLCPDLAIVDLMMDEMDDGFTLCHHLKQRHPGVPILLVTGVASETGYSFDIASPEARGWIKADAILQKPVRFEQLQSEMEKLLHHDPAN